MFNLQDLPFIEAYVLATAPFIAIDNNNIVIISSPKADRIMKGSLLGKNIDNYIPLFCPNKTKDYENLCPSKTDTIIKGKDLEGNKLKLYVFARRSFYVTDKNETTWYKAGFFDIVEK